MSASGGYDTNSCDDGGYDGFITIIATATITQSFDDINVVTQNSLHIKRARKSCSVSYPRS
jgi:hypothetical protein